MLVHGRPRTDARKIGRAIDHDGSGTSADKRCLCPHHVNDLRADVRWHQCRTGCGALLPATSGKPLDLLAPTTPTVTTVKSLLPKPYSLQVR